jgi:hypothetical protein
MTIAAKPSTPYAITTDSLWPAAGALIALTEGTGTTPAELVHTISGSLATTNGGTATPAWVTDSAVGGAALSFAGGTTSSGVPGTDKELHFANIGVTSTTAANGITLFCVYKPSTDTNFNGGVPVSARSADIGIALATGPTPSVGIILGGTFWIPVAPTNLTATHVYGIVVTSDNSASTVVNVHVYDYTTSTRLTDSTITVGAALSAFMSSSASDVVLNCRVSSGAQCLRGELSMGGWFPGIWNSTQVNAFFTNPWEACTATLTLSPSSAAGSGSAIAVTATGNTGFYGAGTPGTPTFTDTGLGTSSISSQVVGTVNTATLQIVPGTSTGTAVIGDGRATASFPVNASPATIISLSGPGTGICNSPTSNYTVSTSGTVSSSLVLTPTSSVGGDTFTPTSVTLTNGSQSATFVLNGAAAGARNVNVTITSGPVITLPSNVVTTLSASTLTAVGITLTKANDTSLVFSLASPTGGNGAYGPLVVYRSTASGFTPGSGNLVASIASPTFPYTFTDTGLARLVPYYYVFGINDAVGDFTATNQFAASTYAAKRIGFGMIGQSHTGFLPDPKPFVTGSLTDASICPAWITSNQGVSGSYSSQWLPGQTNYTNAVAAMTTAFTGQSLDMILILLEFGVNDANTANSSPATFLANLKAIIAGLQAANAIVTGVPVGIVLTSPIPAQVPSGATLAQFNLLTSYIPMLQQLDNGQTVSFLGTDWYNWCLDNPAFYVSGGVHLSQNSGQETGGQTTYGYNVLSFLLARNLAGMLSGGGSPNFNYPNSPRKKYYKGIMGPPYGY